MSEFSKAPLQPPELVRCLIYASSDLKKVTHLGSRVLKKMVVSKQPFVDGSSSSSSTVTLVGIGQGQASRPKVAPAEGKQ